MTLWGSKRKAGRRKAMIRQAQPLDAEEGDEQHRCRLFLLAIPATGVSGWAARVARQTLTLAGRRNLSSRLVGHSSRVGLRALVGSVNDSTWARRGKTRQNDTCVRSVCRDTRLLHAAREKWQAVLVGCLASCSAKQRSASECRSEGRPAQGRGEKRYCSSRLPFAAVHECTLSVNPTEPCWWSHSTETGWLQVCMYKKTDCDATRPHLHPLVSHGT